MEKSYSIWVLKNKILSYFLMFGIFVIIILFAYIISLVYNPSAFFSFLIFGIIFSLIYVVGSYYYADKIALLSVNAYPADPKKYKHLHELIEELSKKANLPKPKVYIMPSGEINAFASGRDEKHAVVCVTEGTLKHLNKEELKGVLAHELSHIKNYDIRFVTLVVVMVGIISIISEMFLYGLWFSSNEREEKNPIFLIIGIILALLAPVTVKLIQLAISRRREFLADAGAVQITKEPKGLINALRKIDSFYKTYSKTNIRQALSPMFIENPFKNIDNLFSTHPPIEERIKILEKIKL